MKLKTDLKIFVKQYVKMAVQNILLPNVYRVMKPNRLKKGLWFLQMHIILKCRLPWLRL